MEWLATGDKNTTYFFQQRANIRRRKNKIKVLLNSEGILVSDRSQMEAMATEFYGNLFTSEGVLEMEDVLDTVPASKVTPAMNSVLTDPYTHEEVKCALFQMFPLKTPRSAGSRPKKFSIIRTCVWSRFFMNTLQKTKNKKQSVNTFFKLRKHFF